MCYNKNLKPLFIIFLVIIFDLFLVGCKSDNKSENTIEIGVILPLTGELASYSQPMKLGMEMAVEDINKSSDIHIELVFSDSKADAKTAVSTFMQLNSINEINYFIGDISSPVTLALIPVVEANKCFLLSPGASSPKLTGISKYFARNYPSSLDESIKTAEYSFNILKLKTASVVYVNSEYGIGLRDAFQSRFNELGGKIVSSETYPFGTYDFKTLILKLKNANPEVVYLAGNQKEMGNFMKQLKESRFSPKVISNISFLEPDCLNIAKSAAEGVIVPISYYNPNDSSFKNAFKFGKIYKAKFQSDPSVAVAIGFDAVKLIHEGVTKKGNNPTEVANYIRNLKGYNGALGIIDFIDGDVNMKTVFKVIQNGKPVNMDE